MARTKRDAMVWSTWRGCWDKKVGARDGKAYGPTSDFKKYKKKMRRAKERVLLKRIELGKHDIDIPKWRKTNIWDWF